MFGLGQFYENLGEYAKALTAYENSCSWFKQHNSTETAHVGVAIARVCFLEGDYDVAWTKAKAAEELCQKAWGPNYYRVTTVGNTCLEILTAVARSRGDLDVAEKYARQLVTKTSFAVDNNKVARHYLELSTVLGMLKKFSEAEGHAQKAEEVLSNIPEKSYLDNVELAKAHLLLATFAVAKQDYKLADNEYRQASNSHRKDKSVQGSLGLVADDNGIALTSSKIGEEKTSSNWVLTACSELDIYINSGFAQLSFAEQCAFISCVRDEVNPLLTFGVSGDSAEQPFKYILRWQGLLIRP